MGRRESGIQSRTVTAAVERYGKRIWIRVKHGTAFAVVGDPDIYGALDGWFFAFEVKNEDGHATKIQLFRIKEIRAAGGMAEVIDTPQDALRFLRLWEGWHR
jgi:hypothetical protein